MTMKTRTTQNLWDLAKSIQRRRFIAIQSYFKKQEKHQTDSLTLHLKQLEKEEQKDPKVSRREIIKTRAEITEKEVKATIAKMNKSKSSFFEKINKIDKPLARLLKKKIIIMRRKIKSIKLKVKKERLQQTAQKYKGS